MAFSKFRVWIVIILGIYITSCAKELKVNSSNTNSETKFEINQIEDCYEILIKEVFPNSNRSELYCLCPKKKEFPKKEYTLKLHYPINRVGINSTTHLGFIENLNQLNSIKAASNLNLFYSVQFNEKINRAEVASLGQGRIEKELLINQNLDVLFTYAIDERSYDEIKSLRNLGQNVVVISEFTEQDPLNKAKWLKVFSLFYGENERAKANSYIAKIDSNYRRLQYIAKKATNRPLCMLGMPWKGNWYISGAYSYSSNFIEDAAGDYIWNDLKYSGSQPIAFEKVLLRSVDSQIWLNPGNYQSKGAIKGVDNRLAEIKAFKNRNIFSNYKRMNDSGGNDYWEKGVVEPDLILADLISIFHPKLLVDHKLKYYFRIDE